MKVIWLYSSKNNSTLATCRHTFSTLQTLHFTFIEKMKALADFYKNVRITQNACCSLCFSDTRCRTAVYSPQGECHLHDAHDSAHPFTDRGWMLMTMKTQQQEDDDSDENKADENKADENSGEDHGMVGTDNADALSSSSLSTTSSTTTSSSTSSSYGDRKLEYRHDKKGRITFLLTCGSKTHPVALPHGKTLPYGVVECDCDDSSDHWKKCPIG